MPIVDLILPKLGESITEATILKWHKQPGDPVRNDETILEIATDKVDSEVPSTAEGIIEAILYKENDVVPVGSPIARIKTADDNSGETPADPFETVQPLETPVAFNEPTEEVNTTDVPYQPGNVIAPPTGNARFFSPLVLNIAHSEGVSLAELDKIPGSGNEGRVTKKDILQYVADKQAGRIPATNQAPAATTQSYTPTVMQQPAATHNTPAISEPATPLSHHHGGNVEIVELDRMRKMIAHHMVESKHVSAHVTSFAEADVTNMVLWRERVKKEFEKREGEKITFTPLFIDAVVRCIKKFPWLNSSLDGDHLIIKKDINIGMATALPNGNLIVPVIHHADQLNLVGLTKKVNSLANAARNNKLKPDDTRGGTFTLTNVGSFGSIMGAPIINQPQVAILAVGTIKKRPVVIETEQGDSIAIRHMMYLSMSYDHRVIDGALGSTFLSAVAKELENFNPNREF